MGSNRIEQLKSFLEDDPKDSFTRFALALEYQKLDELETSIGLFKEIIADEPDYVGVYYHLGGIYEKLGNVEKAARIYTTGIDIAVKINDHHAGKELREALMEIE